MPIETDLSVAPYHDDYDPDKGYVKVLYKPGVAVQARELNQDSTYLQDQIERMGNNIFRRGTITEGVNFVFHDHYPYVKLEDVQIDGKLVVPSNYVGLFLRNGDNLVAQAINSIDGFESSDPDLKTLYVRYINSGDSYEDTSFAPGQILTAYDAQESIHSVEVTSQGTGYSNVDVVVVTPVLLVNVSSGAFSVGDPLTDNATGAEGVIVSIVDETTRVARNILQGTVSVSAATSNVVGTSTLFTSDFANGDWIAVYSNSSSYELRKVNVVSNATFMNLTSNVTFSNATATYANTSDSRQFITYRPKVADLANADSNSTFWTFTTGNTVVGNTASDVLEVIENLGVNASGGITTDSAGRIVKVNVTNGGSGYRLAPFASVKTAAGAGGVLSPKNYYGQVTVASTVGSVGDGYAFGVTQGIIYQKGYFLKVQPQVAVVSKYDSKPDEVVVGFDSVESIVSSNIDTSLLDNATGSPNYTAPGADRLKVTPTLKVLTVDQADANSEFFTLVEWSEGYPYKQNSRTFYNVIGDHIADGIKDGHGDFVTDRFLVTTTTPSNTDLTANTVSIVVDPGTAYIDGHKVETLSNFVTDSPKAVDTSFDPGARVSLNYENYVRLQDVGGMFEFDRANLVDLWSAPKGFLSNAALWQASNTTPQGTKIGEARIRNFVWEQGTPGSNNAVYRAYLFDIRMNPGQNFRSVRSVYQDNGTYDGIGDVVLELDATSNSYVATVQARNNKLLFSAGFEAPLNSNNVQYVYRTIDDTQDISNSGIITVSLASLPGRTFPYTATLSDSQKSEIYVTPGANLVSQANLTGTVNVATNSSNVLGNSTTFLSQVRPGQYIHITGGGANTIIRRVTSVTNNTLLTIESNSSFTQNSLSAKWAWPALVPIQLAFNPQYTANVQSAGEVLNISLGNTLFTATNTDVVIAYNVLVSNAVSTAKTPSRNNLVKLRLANNAANTVGPWCLGVPDIFRMRGVYRGNSSVTTASSNVTDEFFIDHNQNSNYYNHGYLYRRNGSQGALTSDDYLLVEYDSFSTGPGFYTVTSYVSGSKPTRYVEDSKSLAELDNTVNTLEIPEVFDDTGAYYDLINHVDFRPYVNATANVTSNAAQATINPSNVVSFAAADRYFPLPDSIYTHDVEYFRPRVDAIALDKSQRFRIYQGAPGANVAPTIPQGSMRLNNLYIPAYPALPSSVSAEVFEIISTDVYSNKFSSNRLATKRIRTLFNDVDYAVEQPLAYTEYDTGALERRIRDLEYYVGLNSVQTMLKDRVIPSSISPNIDRFKYGFFVDDYENADYSEVTSPEYNAAIVDDFAVPAMTAFNVVHAGALTAAPYTSVKIVSQPIATEPVVVPPPPPPPVQTDYIGGLKVEPPYFKSQSFTVTTTSTAAAPAKTGGKVVCTAMNEEYGFGTFRNAIWVDHSRGMDPRYEVGYHALFLPVVNFAWRSEHRDTWLAKAIRVAGERVARRRTADLWKSRRGKVDVEGRIYRTVLEPLCFVAGYIKEMLDR